MRGAGCQQKPVATWAGYQAEKPDLWDELKSRDIDATDDRLIEYDTPIRRQRRILTCGSTRRAIRVEWLPPAAPGVDAKQEMQLYGMVRTGAEKDAIRF